MAWTTEQKIAGALRLPWTVISETTPEGDRLLRVAELPAAVGTGESDDDLERDFWESFEATIAAYLESGDSLPRPKLLKGPFPWDIRPAQAKAFAVRVEDGRSEVAPQHESGAIEPLQFEKLVGASA